MNIEHQPILPKGTPSRLGKGPGVRSPPMRKLFLIFLLFFFLPISSARADAPAPQIAAYTIEVSLNPGKHTIEGLETVTYRNTTAQPMPDLVFHLYLNAFKSADTIFMKESGSMHRGNAFDPQENGWIDVTGLRLSDGTELQLELLEDGTLARAVLPQPVAPGEAVKFEATFIAQLPRVVARTGWAPDAQDDPFFMVGQWFPKLGVWTDEGWNAYPFHANSEFFADFGSYEVQIRLPKDYVTAGTGLPGEPVRGGDGTQTVTYTARNVIDFAWAASPNLKEASAQVGDVEVRYVYLPEHEWSAARVLDAAEKSVVYYGKWFGPYPYPRLTVLDVPDEGDGAGGMEYPTLVAAGTTNLLGLPSGPVLSSADRGLELVTVHEIGHQWFQSMVATNEAEEPWLDEGMTDYASVRLMTEAYGLYESGFDLGDFEFGYLDLRRFEYVLRPGVPMFGKAWDFTGSDYSVGTYSKPALSLLTLEKVLGEETMLKIMSTYFQRYRFGHPTTEDFRAVAVEVSGQPLDWFFGDPDAKTGLVYGAGTLNYTASEIDARSITAAREGKLAIPTEIEVTFADGSRDLIAWDGKEARKTFTFEKEVRAFTIDPQRKLLVDLIWSDNGLSRRADLPAWLSVVTRLVYHLQNWLIILGGI